MAKTKKTTTLPPADWNSLFSAEIPLGMPLPAEYVRIRRDMQRHAEANGGEFHIEGMLPESQVQAILEKARAEAEIKRKVAKEKKAQEESEKISIKPKRSFKPPK